MKFIDKLETDRCTLKLLCLEDIEEASELFTNPETRKYLGGAIPREYALNRLTRSINKKNIFYFWSVYYCVRLKDTGEFIGMISIGPYHNYLYKELSYQFLPDFWGNGYAYETINSLIQHYKFSHLASETQSANLKSCSLLEKLGYKLHKKLERFGCEQSVYVLKKVSRDKPLL
ncbi:MAG: GNAT family N-acetyltransferase [Bacillota bacterium]|nr:GNAT family N-acetyltransferase [Bacillota bacterium]